MIFAGVMSAQVEHSLYLGSGASFALPGSPGDYQYPQVVMRADPAPATPPVTEREAFPQHAQGQHFQLGYQLDFNRYVGVFTESSYLRGTEWIRDNPIEFYDEYELLTRSHSYRQHLGLRLSLGKEQDYWQGRFLKNTSLSLAGGFSLNQTRIFHHLYNREPSSYPFYHQWQTRKGLGTAYFGQLDINYRLAPALYLRLSGRLEYGYYRSHWWQHLEINLPERFWYSDFDNQHIFYIDEARVYPLHHWMIHLSVGWQIGGE